VVTSPEFHQSKAYLKVVMAYTFCYLIFVLSNCPSAGNGPLRKKERKNVHKCTNLMEMSFETNFPQLVSLDKFCTLDIFFCAVCMVKLG